MEHYKEQIEAKLQTFPDGYRNSFLEEVKLEDIKKFAVAELEKKKQQRIAEAFSNMVPQALMCLIDELDKRMENAKSKQNVYSNNDSEMLPVQSPARKRKAAK